MRQTLNFSGSFRVLIINLVIVASSQLGVRCVAGGDGSSEGAGLGVEAMA